MQTKEALKTYFGYESFRQGQKEVTDALVNGRDVLAVMPTGAGKSICYQIPAVCMDGITVVVSPLISLMKDQVSALEQVGIPAAYLNSSLTPVQTRSVLEQMRQGQLKLIYVAPERLTNEQFLNAVNGINISMVAVDEAHCISQWGQNFRPDYLKISQFISKLAHRPVIGAFTATATDAVKEDIEEQLDLRDPYKITTGFDRPNLYFGVIASKDRGKDLLALMNTYKDRSGIVYCGTRNNVEEITALLKRKGYDAVRYHAGLSEEERRINQEMFTMDRCSVVVATNAFGMGIDKSNVSYVIHYNMPKSIEAYYQEAGRAGRDGEPADCILLYSPEDVHLNNWLIEHAEPNPDHSPQMQKMVKKADLERLKQMTFYATTKKCLRAFILKYFGEDGAEYCGNCSSCSRNFKKTDMTVEAQKIMSAVIRSGQRYGANTICDILLGNGTDRIIANGLDQLSVYGIMKTSEKRELFGFINELKRQGYLMTGEEPYQIISVDKSALPVLKGTQKVSFMQFKETERTVKTDSPDTELFNALKALRTKIALEAGVPAFTVLTDATLRQIARQKPKTKGKLKQIQGIGKVKLNRYGNRILDVVEQYDGK